MKNNKNATKQPYRNLHDPFENENKISDFYWENTFLSKKKNGLKELALTDSHACLSSKFINHVRKCIEICGGEPIDVFLLRLG